VNDQAFPLSWPDGWPRHKGHRDSDRRFSGPTFRWDRVVRGVHEEIARIGGSKLIISTNQPIRQDGLPYAQSRNIDDVGVALYFERGKRSLVMAQDRFWSIIGNMRSLTMAIEGLRQMERHGGAVMMERAFAGFAALPPPTKSKHWREVLMLDTVPMVNIAPATIQNSYSALARKRHPDVPGGSHELMSELNNARDAALKEVR
jgi:hypothetical protein